MARPAAKGDATLEASRTYEVQRHTQGRWTVDTVSDDKEVAIELAKSVMSGRRPPSGVRVISVELRDDGKFSEIAIYRSTMMDQNREEAPPARPKVETKPQSGTDVRDFNHSGRPRDAAGVRGGFWNLMRTLRLAFGLAATLAALEAVRLLMR